MEKYFKKKKEKYTVPTGDLKPVDQMVDESQIKKKVKETNEEKIMNIPLISIEYECLNRVFDSLAELGKLSHINNNRKRGVLR